MSQSGQCVGCNRYEGGLACSAFPEGIPEEIISGEFDHREPFPGDDGLQWIPLRPFRPGEAEAIVEEEAGALSASAGTLTDEMAATEQSTGTRWRSVLVLEGVETDDGRLIVPGALEWRDLPLTLMGMTVTGPGGHEGAEVAGRIDTITRNDRTGEVIGEGVFDSGEFGAEITRMVGDEVLRGVSVDLAIREFEIRGEDGEALGDDADPFTEDRVIFAVTDASIMGATVCPFPAFADAHIELLASGGPDALIDRARFVFGPITLVADGGPAAELLARWPGPRQALQDLRVAFDRFSAK